MAGEPNMDLNFDDPKVEERWCNAQRNVVAKYLRTQRVNYNEIGDWPAWHVAPYVAIWAVESRKRPGWIGWWVISGDLPTDHISAADINPPQHPRKALQAILKNWSELAKAWELGTKHPNLDIPKASSPELRAELLPLLSARIEFLGELVQDDSVWEER